MKEIVEEVQQSAEPWDATHVLRWSYETFGDDIEIASGFGVEGVVLIDIAARLVHPRVFILDTDFLFPETYALIERVEKRYGIRVERLKSARSPEEQEEQSGGELWKREPDACCESRKVEPLRKKLVTLRAWATSIRRDQTSVRASVKKVEWDSKFQLVKINPLADWSSEKVWDYVRKQEVPYNPLHDRGFPSIGCTHCTRSVQVGEDSRAGRWPGFAKTECGLHTSRPVEIASAAGSSDSA